MKYLGYFSLVLILFIKQLESQKGRLIFHGGSIVVKPVEFDVKPGIMIATEGSVIFDCVKYDCKASVLVCTNGVIDCTFICEGSVGGGDCDGVEAYSAARGNTEFRCDGKDACLGAYFNCGLVIHRNQDGFRVYPGYDKENVGGIRSNSLFEGVYGKCSLHCGNVGCKETHLECNGDWTHGCFIHAGVKPDAFMQGIFGVRLKKKTQIARLYCDKDKSCGNLVEFHCLKENNCKCEGKGCKGIKVQRFPPLEIPPTAKCQKHPHAVVNKFASCRANFECNVYCESFTCHNCSKFDCNGDDSCAGTKSRGLKLERIIINGDPVHGVEVGCNGDRTCKDQGGKLSAGYLKKPRGFVIKNLNMLICSGDNSCEGSHFDIKAIKGGANIECGDNACLYSTIKADWLRRLNCNGQNTCAYLNLTAGVITDYWGFSCGQDGCHGANFKIRLHPNVTIIKGIFCSAEDSCKNFKLHITAVKPVTIEKLECSNEKSCNGARFSSTGPVKWPKVACAGIRSPCHNFKLNGKFVLPPTKAPTKSTTKAQTKAPTKSPVKRI